MHDIVIKAEHVSKKFIIGHQTGEKYTALRDVIASNVKNLWRRTRELASMNYSTEGNEEEEFWALRDLNFEIRQGDRVGIIGRNGAGKSTLLKVLSRITEPTEGRITIKGRVASLLEVGTGFHPELTGRENIFLNGAILGMSRAEIRAKFDEIVAFAEVERFLDTPVKRYSSGMYVRLAFAVAAHLEPEILIVDEVLAVGDAQFQKKCLGKMEDVSKNQGRTVLFVSHNMGVISQFCSTGFLLNKGLIHAAGKIEELINSYLTLNETSSEFYENFKGSKDNQFLKIYSSDPEGKMKKEFSFEDSIFLNFEFRCKFHPVNQQIGIGMHDKFNNRVFTILRPVEEFVKVNDVYHGRLELPRRLFAPTFFTFVFALWSKSGEVFDLVENVAKIQIHDNGTDLAAYSSVDYGSIILNPKWHD